MDVQKMADDGFDDWMQELMAEAVATDVTLRAADLDKYHECYQKGFSPQNTVSLFGFRTPVQPPTPSTNHGQGESDKG